jgi:hypothetical protein
VEQRLTYFERPQIRHTPSKVLCHDPKRGPSIDSRGAWLQPARGNDLKAIRMADAKGNIDGTSAIVWTLDRDTW